MTSVLVVDDDQALVSAISRDLRSNGFDVCSADSVDAALVALAQQPTDVVITDLRMAEADGIDLLLAVRESGFKCRPILMSAYATARDHQKAMELGAVRVLCKPFGSQELLDAIQQAIDCGTGFRGSVHGLSLIDMLQMFHYGHRSITLRVEDNIPGEIVFEGGEIVHAQHGSDTGESALQVMLGMSTGAFSTAPFYPRERTVQRSFQSLLLDLLRCVDEGARAVSQIDLDSAEFFGRPTVPPASGPEIDVDVFARAQIDAACRAVVERVDGGVACGVVSLETAELIGYYTAMASARSLNDFLAAATMDLFRGPNICRVEQMVRAHRGIPEDGEHYFAEFHIASLHNFHFAKTLKGGKAVMMLVTEKTSNIGLGWAQLNAALPEVEPHVA